MSRLFALTVACCCAKFETVQTFSYVQTDAKQGAKQGEI